MMTGSAKRLCRKDASTKVPLFGLVRSMMQLCMVFVIVVPCLAGFTNAIAPYEPLVVSMPSSFSYSQELFQAVVRRPDNSILTNYISPQGPTWTWVSDSGNTNLLCPMLGLSNPTEDIVTTAGVWQVVVAGITNTYNVRDVTTAEQSLVPVLQSNLLLQVIFMSAPTDINNDFKARSQQILAVVTNGVYADYARTYLAMDALYSPMIDAKAALTGSVDLVAGTAAFDSFTITNGLLRATYLYHKGQAQLRGGNGIQAVGTLCTLLNEFPEGLHPSMARELLNHIYQGAVAWYPSNEGAGVAVADMICSGPSGQLAGSSLPVWGSGLEGTALQFDGGGYVTISNNPALAVATNQVSLVAWVKASTNSSGPVIARTVAGGATGSFALSLTNGSVAFKLFLQGAPTTVTSTNALPDNKWHHLAGVYDGQHLRVYLDGTQAGTVSGAGTVDVVNESLLIGRNADGAGFVGTIDDVRIFARALSDEDVADIFTMDSDADGLSNAQELNVYQTNPAQPDSDGDGLSDGDEIGIHFTNPNNADSDGDGVSDYAELWDRGTDPTNAASLNIILYANSVIGSNGFDGLTATVTNSHGPKLTIQAAITNAISGDTIQIAGDQAPYTENVLDPGDKSITLKPTGSVAIHP